MNTSKSSKWRDRLIELPDSLISHIFWMLPMRDVVRTTILSKNWKNLWTTISCLNFNFDSDWAHHHDADAFRVFVNRALMFWKGVTIQKFKIGFLGEMSEELITDIDTWVRFAKDNRVQELYLHLDHDSYTVPRYLLSYSSLKVLSLEGCSLQIICNRSVQWNQLKSLTITFYDEMSNANHVIDQVMSCSPQLETLILTTHQANPNLTIRSSSLTWLSIHNSFCFECAEVLDKHYDLETELRIRTPNLETFEISGFPYARCSLKHVPYLTCATLDFFNTNEEGFENGFLEDALKQILPTIRNVQNVTLSNWCIEVLGEMKKKHLLSRMNNVTFLKIVRGSFEEFVEKAGLLEIFPQLMDLVIEVADQSVPAIMFDAKSHLNFQTSLPHSFLRQLRTFEVTWAEKNHSIFPLIQIVLRYACKLEKMVFRVKGRDTSSQTLFSASQKLLRMQRSSPTAELIFPS